MVLGGVILRLAFLSSDSFWLDEAFSVTSVMRHGVREIWQASPDPQHPPLYFVVLWLAVHLGGPSEAVARLPSALASVLNLLLMYVLSRRLGLSVRAAGWAVALLAFAPLDVWYAQEARMYALVTTTALMFAIGLALDSTRGAVLAAAALATGLYVDFTMVALSSILTSLWFVRWMHTGRRRGVVSLVVAALLAGWLLFLPEWSHLGQVLRRIDTVPLLVNLRRWLGLRIVPGPPAIAVLMVIAVAAGGVVAVVWNALHREAIRTVWGWMVWAGLVLASLTFALPRGYSAKQFLATGWPFVVIIVAWSLTDALSNRDRTRTAIAPRLRLPAAVVVSLVAAIVTVATPRADWRGAVGYLNQRVARTEAVWLDPPWNDTPYNIYKPVLGAVVSGLQSADANVARLGNDRDVCLVAERFGTTPPTATEVWLDAHLKLVEAVPFARLQVRCYRR